MQDEEKRYKKDLKKIKSLRLMDDDFMSICFDGDIEATELVLRIILEKPDISVISVKTQKQMKSLSGRDIWLDIDARDSEGREYDIEIQRQDKGADRKRARYHSSMLDALLLKPTEDFSILPETYVIFITENDVIGENEAIYSVERIITNSGRLFNDGEHIVYVNGSDRDSSTELGRLMQDFFCVDPSKMNYKPLADKVRYYKETERGVNKMCRVFEEIREEAARETAIRTSIQEKESIAKRLLEMKLLSMEDIARSVEIPVERVAELAKA